MFFFDKLHFYYACAKLHDYNFLAPSREPTRLARFVPSSAVTKQMIGFWGEEAGYVSYDIHVRLFYLKCFYCLLTDNVSDFVESYLFIYYWLSMAVPLVCECLCMSS